MKILNVVTHLDPVTGGGCTERTRQMSRYLAKSGQEVTLLTTDCGLRAESPKGLEGVRIEALPTLIKRFFVPVPALNRVRKAVAEAEVVHLIGHWSFMNALVYLYLKRLHKPYVVCPVGCLPIRGRSKVLKRIFNLLIGKRLVRDADAGILVTASELPDFEDYGLAADRLKVIPNAIDWEESVALDLVDFREKTGLGQNPFMLFMGRLNWIKGPDLLVQAFCEALEELSPYHLVLAGPDGGLRQEIEKTVARFGAGARIHLVGYLENPAKMQVYREASLLVIPSRHEAMSLVVLEAGVSGTPVLITSQCGFDEVDAVKGGEVVPASVAGLKAGLLRVVRAPDEMALQGENLKRFVLDNFRWDAIVVKYLELYRQLLGINRAA